MSDDRGFEDGPVGVNLMAARTENEVHGFWERRASQVDLSDVEVTHKDVWQRFLEIETVKRFLRTEDRALDVGCGNGYATLKFAPLVNEIVGIDFSAAMISRAADSAARPERDHRERRASFRVLDVLELAPETAGTFDVVTSIRCLINLSRWADQQRAIENIASVLRPGGRFIFVEGCQQGRRELDALRTNVGLKTMPVVWHNLDFDRDTTLEFVSRFFRIKEMLHFGTYDFISRVVHPLYVAPEDPQYDSKFNRIAAELALQVSEFGRLSRVLFLVLERM